MELHDLTEEQIVWVYHNWLSNDFQPDERKPLSRIQASMQEGIYRCIGIFEAEQIRGYAFFVTITQNGRQELLLDYFAVDRTTRSRGIGSAFLKAVPALFPDAGAVIIEAEQPDAAETADDRSLRERRISFYQRCGCTDTGARAKVFGTDYVLLQLPVTVMHSTEDIRQIYAAVYQRMLPETLYRTQIALA